MAKQNLNNEELKWYQKLRVKYKLTIRRQDTYEERVAFQISRLYVIIFTGVFAILLIVLTSLLIAYTPLKEYIPGQTELETRKKLYVLQQKTDSIEKELFRKDLFLNNLQRILNGGEIPEWDQGEREDSIDYKQIELRRSHEDSVLREQFEKRRAYDLNGYNPVSGNPNLTVRDVSLPVNFFKPVSGYVTNKFNAETNHFGVDIVPDEDKTVKAVHQGTVLFSEWTVSTGNVIIIQHSQNLITVYKHNATLLKNQGEFVESGDPVAISGESGELSTGPHLHFELWMNGTPVDPEKYILF
ncbi:MAG TPA: M23 family metallopeptidase [Bacteroidales bacterium]|nr:M23 family metallopeptidase [Bacteroidales bacterium]